MTESPKELQELRSRRQVRVREQAEIEWRMPGDPEQKDVRNLIGYPAVFNQPTILYEGRDFVIREVIAEGFFDGVLEDDCHLNYVHESGSAMCRNNPHMPPEKRGGAGSMELSADAHGLRMYAKVPMNDPDAQRMAAKMDNGVVDQMSFAFTVKSEDYLRTEEDGRTIHEYTLRECGRLYDVTVCPLGAYSQTEAALRTIAPILASRSEEGGEVLSRSEEGKEGEPDRSKEDQEYEQFLDEADSRVAQFSFKEI